MTSAPRPAPRLLVVLGSTGTGKSEVAVELALRLGGEIVGCDAFQVYRGLDAATAKPDAKQLASVPHHLVSCVDPETDFSMADYVLAAERAIEEVTARGRVIVIVGGTGLYLRGLLRGVIEAPSRDERLRARVRRIIERGGESRLRRWLGRRDPESRRRIRPGDKQRLVRAVELALLEGDTWGERLRRAGTWESGRERYRSLKIGLEMARQEHVRRLDARVDAFFEAGLVDEILGLLARGVSREANAFKAIGYREVLEAIGRGADPDTVRGAVRGKTRRYARRQRTWFRREPGVHWFDAGDGIASIVDRASGLWHRGSRDDGAQV